MYHKQANQVQENQGFSNGADTRKSVIGRTINIMKQIILKPLVFCVMIGLASNLSASEYITDPADSSRISFESTAKLEFIDGYTYNVQARINCNLDSLDREDSVNGFVLVDLRTLKTGIPTRDEHMRDRHLQTDSYPFARFELVEVEGLPNYLKVDSLYSCTINGKMTLHGQTEDLKASAVVSRPGAAPERLTVSASFQIALADYEIPYPQALFLKLAKVLKLELTLNLREMKRED